jgi:anti-sigma factor RsiW
MAGAHPEDFELLAYVEEELGAARAREIAEHAESCAVCTRQIGELETARNALRAAPALRLPVERRDRLVAELPASAGRPRAAPRRLLVLAAALAAVAALLAVVATQENGPGVGGEAEQAAEQPQPATGAPERSTDTTAPEAAAGKERPLAQVEGPPSRVAEFLRGRGYDARIVDGSVEVRAKRRAPVRRLLSGRFPRGDVGVYVR